MAFEDSSSNMVMPVSPMYYGGGNGNGGFGGNGDWSWVVLLILLLAIGNNGFGNGNNGGGYGNGMMPFMMGSMTGGYDLYPWLNNSEHISDGFRDAQLHDSVTSVRDGINSLSTQLCNCCGDISTQLCNGFSGVTASVTGAQNAIAQQMYANQIADMERSFNAQTASTQGMNSIQSQLAQCCCDNRLATESLRATVLSENCADRFEASNNTRDIITALTSGIQSIKDEICADRLDGYKRENDALRTQLNMANLAASQTRQTTDIQNSIINELRSCPIPAQPVFGNQPIFTCPTNVGNMGCGCGCNG